MEEQQSRRPETGDSHEYRLRFSLARSLQTKESLRKTKKRGNPFLSSLPKVSRSCVPPKYVIQLSLGREHMISFQPLQENHPLASRILGSTENFFDITNILLC